MKPILVSLLLLLSCSLVAQKNNGSVKGIIYDSINDYALQSASITVFKQADSSVVEFQLSNTSGEFEIKNLPVDRPLYLVVSHSGYRTFINNFTLDSSGIHKELNKILLAQRDENELEEIVIKAVQPLRMNGDTLEINPDAFKLDSNSVVEDMLLRVPGMTVWGDGTITMNGRKIEKLYVDGKPFFGGGTQTATQNLPKNAIERIQLYQEKDLSKVQNTDEKVDSLYSMNIKLKEDKKKGMFGKVGGGYGTDDRYVGDGVMQFYNKKTQAGIAAGINNINKEEGTGENAFIENTFKSNFRIFFGGRGNPNDGITRRTYGNIKVQHNFSESENSQFYNRLNADYGYLNTSRNVTTSTTNVQNIDDYKQTNISSGNSRTDNTTNNVKFNYENRKQYGNFTNISVNYTNQYTTSNSTNNTNVFRDNTELSRSDNTSHSSSGSNNINMFGFLRSNDAGQLKDPRKNFNTFFSGSYSDFSSSSNTVSRFESFVDTIPSNIIDRNYNNRGRNYNADINFNYDGFRNLLFGIYNFYNINMALSNGFTLSRNEVNSVVTDLDTLSGQYVNNDLLTNTNTLTNFYYRPGLNFNKSFYKSVWEKNNYWLNISFDLQYQFLNQKNESSILQRNIERAFNSFTPRMNVNFNYTKNNAFRIYSYLFANRRLNPPSIDQLFPIVDSTSRYNIIAGNPNLKPSNYNSGNWNFNISRNKMNVKTNYTGSLGANLNVVTDAISDNVVYDSSGRSVRHLINVKKQSNFGVNGGFEISHTLNKMNSVSFNYRNTYNTNNRPGFVNYVAATSKNTSWSNTFNLQYNRTDKFNVSVGETINSNRSLQRSNRDIASHIRNYTTSGNANYFITKELTLNTSVNYQRNIAADGNTLNATIWNANAVYRFMQQKAELRLSAFDLLRQNQNIQNFVSENSATTTITNGLQQYFMVTFSYYPRKFGGNTRRQGMPSGGIMIMR